jgi:hypothetical protein
MNHSAITIKIRIHARVIFFFRLCVVVVAAAVLNLFPAQAAEKNPGYGFAFAQFMLTLEDGFRTEAAGPFFYSQQRDSEKIWALPPFFCCDRDPITDRHEHDFFYPLLTHTHYGHESRWQLFQMLSFSGGDEPDETGTRRFTLFPFYFQQRAAKPELNYTALLPFYGHLKNRLFRSEIDFLMLPLYIKTKKRDVVTENYLFPFFHLRHGDGLNGWQAWPLAGREHKAITTVTNGYGETNSVPGHHKIFYAWPLYLRQDNGLGSENPEKFRGSIPFFSTSRSPLRDSTSFLFPFFTLIEDREKKYREWEGPWPFVIFTRGEGKTTDRVWPLFSRSHNASKESDSYLWPLYIYKSTRAEPLDKYTRRFGLLLYAKMVEKNTATGLEKRRTDVWPLFTWKKDFNGNARLQILAPLEPAVPNNRGIENNWSPLWSLFRSEDNFKTGAASRSILWNLYRRDSVPGQKKVSLLFGLFRYETKIDGDGPKTSRRILYLPF